MEIEPLIRAIAERGSEIVEGHHRLIAESEELAELMLKVKRRFDPKLTPSLSLLDNPNPPFSPLSSAQLTSLPGCPSYSPSHPSPTPA